MSASPLVDMFSPSVCESNCKNQEWSSFSTSEWEVVKNDFSSSSLSFPPTWAELPPAVGRTALWFHSGQILESSNLRKPALPDRTWRNRTRLKSYTSALTGGALPGLGAQGEGMMWKWSEEEEPADDKKNQGDSRNLVFPLQQRHT